MVKSDRADCVKAISVLGVEDSAIHYLTGEARITNCSHCTCNVLVPVPCPGCIHIVFCSIKCRYINQQKLLISDLRTKILFTSTYKRFGLNFHLFSEMLHGTLITNMNVKFLNQSELYTKKYSLHIGKYFELG